MAGMAMEASSPSSPEAGPGSARAAFTRSLVGGHRGRVRPVVRYVAAAPQEIVAGVAALHPVGRLG